VPRPLLAALLLLAACAAGGACADGRAAPPRHPTAAAPRPASLDTARLSAAYARAAQLPKLRSLLVQWHDTLVAERYFGGATAARPANLKSASKSVISALVGVALADGTLPSVSAPIAALLAPADARLLDSAKRTITVEDLLSMRAGLQSTSIRNYGAWVSSRDWVRYALTRPLVAPPGHAGGR
jgi:CubicO group peptidase (beta-lactamase class C family)